MSMPSIVVRIAFANDPLTAPGSLTWTDVSSYVRSFRIRRGRNDELGLIEAGTAEVVLDNRDRRFDPTYTSGAYYPNVLPAKRINIRATWNAVTYDLFTGFVEAWPIDWPNSTDSTVAVQAADGFKLLGASDQSMFIAEQLSGASIFSTLNPPNGWPNSSTDLDTGATTIAAVNATLTPLQRIQNIVEAEQGLFFIRGDGFAVFQDRHARLLDSASAASQGTFGDSGAELPYDTIEPSYDDTYLFNNVRVTPDGGSEQAATDTASQTAYFLRTLTKTGLPIGGSVSAANNEAASMASYLLGRFSNPALRFRRVAINPQADDTNLWPHVLGREISDRITVKRRPPGGGNVVSQDCFIESIEHEAVAGPETSWRTTWQLSPTDNLAYFILDSATNGLLDTNRLGY